MFCEFWPDSCNNYPNGKFTIYTTYLLFWRVYWGVNKKSTPKGAFLLGIWRWGGSQYQTPPTQRILACKSCYEHSRKGTESAASLSNAMCCRINNHGAVRIRIPQSNPNPHRCQWLTWLWNGTAPSWTPTNPFARVQQFASKNSHFSPCTPSV